MSTKVSFAQSIMDRTYAHPVEEEERLETWDEIAARVTKNVMKAVGVNMRQRLAQDIQRFISEKKLIPGGRYLYAAGNQVHQTQNCLLLKVHDSREGWSELLSKASMGLMTGAGIGVDYSDIRPEGAPIRKTGGVATGPISLMQIVNECGRGIIQGGNRRSALWAGLRWSHPDVHRFIRIKNWPPEIRALKEKDCSFPAVLDMTNISVQLDDEFFEAYQDDEHPQHAMARSVYWACIDQMLKTGEPGFSVDVGKNSGETLRNAPLSADTSVLTNDGYRPIRELIDIPTTLWTGQQWASNVVFTKTASQISTLKVNISGGRSIKADPTHEFFVENWTGRGSSRRLLSIEKKPASELRRGDILVVSLPSSTPQPFDTTAYTLGFLFGDGSIGAAGQGEITLCTDEKKVLVDYFDAGLISSITNPDTRGYTRVYFRCGSFSQYTKTQYPRISRDALPSWIAGVFDADGNYDKERQCVRLSASYEFLENMRRDLESLGVLATITKAGKSGYTGAQCYLLCIMASSLEKFQQLIPTKRLELQLEGYTPYRESKVRILGLEPGPQEDVFCCDVKCDEHSFVAEGVLVSNCGEVASRETDEICNLTSINLSRVESLEEFKQLIDVGTAFLLAGSVYSDVPYSDVDKMRSKNRRLGLGLMGVHEWLLVRGKQYGPDEELGQWLSHYAKSGKYANRWADEWGLSHPKKTRAIAPNGTTSIVAETTGGIEPIFCVAYKRRYLKGDQQCYQYVVDPCAKRLIEQGIKPELIEDAYTLAQDVERRVAFQSWVQGYVDHCISSTINMPAYGTELNNADLIRPFGAMLMRYLPNLRGITCYPDGSRAGQPLSPVPYAEAIQHEGIEMVEESMNVCSLRGGSCGD
jgi:ribonucleotide reductase alpha subunit